MSMLNDTLDLGDTYQLVGMFVDHLMFVYNRQQETRLNCSTRVMKNITVKIYYVQEIIWFYWDSTVLWTTQKWYRPLLRLSLTHRYRLRQAKPQTNFDIDFNEFTTCMITKMNPNAIIQ